MPGPKPEISSPPNKQIAWAQACISLLRNSEDKVMKGDLMAKETFLKRRNKQETA
jgi:hypothetical protein